MAEKENGQKVTQWSPAHIAEKYSAIPTRLKTPVVIFL